MPVKFNIVERGNPSNREAPKKYYPSIQSSGRVTTREMAEMAAERSTLSTVDMMAAIESFLTIVPQQLAKGNIVELGEFGSFWLKTTSDGADAVEAVNATQITSILPRFNPGKKFKSMLKTIEYAKGAVVKEPDPEPQNYPRNY
jgi:predicted histone-like DNA-binding protein